MIDVCLCLNLSMIRSLNRRKYGQISKIFFLSNCIRSLKESGCFSAYKNGQEIDHNHGFKSLLVHQRFKKIKAKDPIRFTDASKIRGQWQEWIISQSCVERSKKKKKQHK